MPFLCNNKTCTVRIENRILYNDPRHLSEEGGQYLAKESIQTLSSF